MTGRKAKKMPLVGGMSRATRGLIRRGFVERMFKGGRKVCHFLLGSMTSIREVWVTEGEELKQP